MSTTLLIDGQWVIKKNFHKRINYEAKGVKCGGSYGFLDSLRTVISKILPDRVVVMWDGENSGELRYDIYKPYKSNRKKSWGKELEILNNSDFLVTDEDKEKFDLMRQKSVAQELLQEFCIRQAQVNKIEADDLIAYYILASNRPDEKIVIYSRDKDYLQLISNSVSILSPDTFELITIENFKQTFGYTIDNALIFKCFKGDSSDKISGVSGVTVEKLLEHFPRMADEKYTHKRLVEESYNKKREKKLKFYDKIINCGPILYRNAELMNLKQPFVNDEAKKIVEEVIVCKLDTENFTINSAMSLFMSKGFSKFVSNQYMDIFFAPYFMIMNKEKEYSRNN